MVTENIKRYKSLVDKELQRFFEKKISSSKDISKGSEQMTDLLRSYTLRGGKRIRAMLVYYGYLCFSQKDLKQVIRASMSIELIQSFLLIHDDIIDKDDLRRNGPTMHNSYKSIAKRSYDHKDPDHFGNSMAILAGDLASTFAFEILSSTSFDEKTKFKAISYLNDIVSQVIHGELLDILAEVKTLDKYDIEKIHHLKTASYTIEGPLKLGAILASAKPRQLKALSDYAIPLGKAFQLQDDILGIFSTEKKLGKPIGSDIRQGKQTLLIIKALERSNNAQKKFIKDKLNDPNITSKDITKIRSILKDTGSLDYSKDLIKDLIIRSKKSLSDQKLNPKAKDFLLGLADYISNRKY